MPKPGDHTFLSASNLQGGEALPFAKIAASGEQLDSHFRFGAEDRALVQDVLGAAPIAVPPGPHDG